MIQRPLVLFGHRIRLYAWWRDVRMAFRTLVGDTTSDQRLLEYMSNRADLAKGLQEFNAAMPQADIVDDTVTLHENTNTGEWRLYFGRKLSGRGLELGPLNHPLPTHPGMQMSYLDRADTATLKASYPEVADKIGRVDIVDDAETMPTVADASFDFVVAAHVIEHTRNPIATLRTWLRVLKPGGLLYIVVPDKRYTFDRARVRTTLEHVIFDYLEPSRERDLEHFLDYARFVNNAPREEAVAEARRLAAEDHSIHFHTFIPKDMVGVVQWTNAHVTPVSIEEGPAMSPQSDEFHLLLRKPARLE